MTESDRWTRFLRYYISDDTIGLALDISRMHFDDAFLDSQEPAIQAAFDAMEALERGAIANPDENRRVGHYWLRAPQRAPTAEIAEAIRRVQADVRQFAAAVHAGRLHPPRRARFTHVLLIGIGGSALGPMFLQDALGSPDRDRMALHFLDNTDPDGIERVLSQLRTRLDETLVIVVSKSGSTPETRNGMLLAAAAFRSAGLEFAPHAVAVTAEGSALDRQAQDEGWIARFPMWDWVGGRTSAFSAVGLLPAALQGLDIDAFIAGAAACDEATRRRETRRNPAALLALMWRAAGPRRNMIVLPYKDRLLLLGRYLQQLIMESLGKRLDLDGRVVEEGLTVFGNKGSTDQHAYIQQLRDGLDDFFAMFIRVLEDRSSPGSRGVGDFEVERGVTAGDYLHGFLLGTREALSENGRRSLTLTLRRADAFHLGVLIALFERAVGLYASLIRVNAYHQPGVEAGKKAAASVLEVQRAVLAALSPEPRTASQIAQALQRPDSVETVYHVLQHLAANGRAGAFGTDPATATFTAS